MDLTGGANEFQKSMMPLTGADFSSKESCSVSVRRKSFYKGQALFFQWTN